MLEFAKDFKPDVWIEGGDDLDCGPVSHWLKDKKRSTEGLRMRRDIDEYNAQVLQPIDEIMGNRELPDWARRKRIVKGGRKKKLRGNHEAWIDQLVDREPGLEGLLDLPALLNFESRGWEYFDSGDVVDIGKISFTHGDTIPGGGENFAKAAVMAFGKSVRVGHHHTHQVFTKHSPVDATDVHSGVGVPALCHKAPSYGKKTPNKWALGFNYGYVFEDGTFNDYVPIISNGRVAINGKVYRG
jgi:hypothetical protein